MKFKEKKYWVLVPKYRTNNLYFVQSRSKKWKLFHLGLIKRTRGVFLIAVIIFLPFAFVPNSYSFSSADCAEYLATQKTLLTELSQAIASNMQVFWLLHQLGFYGVFEEQRASLRYQNENVVSIEIGGSAVMRPIIFGYQIRMNSGIPSWLGGENAQLYCIEHVYNGYEPYDACCVYDERNTRKRTREQDDLDFGKKGLRLMLQPDASYSTFSNCH